MPQLPQPKRNALEVINITAALTGAAVDQFLPLVGTAIREAVRIAVDKQMERGKTVLLDELSRRGIVALEDPQLEFYVPAYYRFLEQVRLGEYDHNLLVLAKLIAGELAGATSNRDVGRVGRAAHKLHLLTHDELAALAHCLRIFESPGEMPRDGHSYVLTTRKFVAVPGPLGMAYDFRQAHGMLHELSVRGLLVASGTPGFGEEGYYRSTALDEIGDALRDVATNP